MWFKTPSWQKIAGQTDVQPSLHVPMVYERVPSSPWLWEYRVLSVNTREEPLPNTESLDELGNQGWLLISVLEQRLTTSGSRIHYHFVRRKEAEEA